jgi:hypothetical protein
MDHIQILKRAWNILWSYKTLWIFGIILALTSASSGGGGSSNGGGSGSGSNGASLFHLTPPAEITREVDKLNRLFSDGITVAARDTWITIAVVAACVLLLLFILFRIGYYVSQTSLIRMVDGFEDTGERVKWRQGFRLGWSRSAWRLFLIDLVIYLPMVLAVIIIFGCAALPFILGGIESNQPSVPAILAAVGIAFLGIFLVVIVAFALSLIMEPIRRVCVLQGLGVFDSIRNGWQLVRNRFKDIFIMWLLIVGVQIGYFIVMIPVAILVFGVSMLLGGGTGLLIYALTNAAATATQAWIPAVVSGGVIFLLVIAIPFLFLGGLKETYLSSTWTLTYRELVHVKPQELPLPLKPAPDTTDVD